MKFRLNAGVFIRHNKGESIVWCPSSSGCTILQNSQCFLDEIVKDWREENECVESLACKYGWTPDEVRDDMELILGELIAQGFVAFAGLDNVHANKSNDLGKVEGKTNEHAMASFCKRHNIPAELHIDLTDDCTERCVHCYVPRNNKHYLSFKMIEKALREFRLMNGLTVHLTGGEVMMHPDFESVCRLCAELELNLVIFSNLTLCSDARITLLKEINPQFVNVSLYSMSSAEHDRITQLQGSWKRTMDAILRCCVAGVRCRIAVPVLRENRNSLMKLKNFADEHGIVMVPTWEIVAKADHGCDNLGYACSAEEMRDMLSRDYCLFQSGYDGVMPSRAKKVCGIGEGRLYLNAQGNYYPCDSMHEYVLGNVRENTVEEIWKGEKLNYLRGLKNHDFGSCATCGNRPWCKVCPAANFNATGDLFKHHPSTCALAGVVREVYSK